MDDREVVAVSAADNLARITTAYDEYAPSLYGYCSLMLRQPAEVAEALVDVFVIAAMSMRDLPKVPELRPLLYSIARRECLRRLQTRLVAGDDAVGGLPIDATMPMRALYQLADPLRPPIDATMPMRAADGLAHGHPEPGQAVGPLPAELRERVLRLCAAASEVTAYRRKPGRDAGPARLARDSPTTRPARRAGIRGNPGPAIATVAVLLWVVAAVSVVVLTLSGSHSARAQPARPSARPSVSSPVSSPRSSSPTP